MENLTLDMHGLVERAIRQSFEATDYELKVIRGELPMPIMSPIRIPMQINRSSEADSFPMNPKEKQR